MCQHNKYVVVCAYQCRGGTLIALKDLHILLEREKSKGSVGNEAIISLDRK